MAYFCGKDQAMLTKYCIEIDGEKREIPNSCIRNWDEVKCAYKRADFSGVTRSFTSQFEFVGEAYDMLINLYLRDGFNAVAVLCLLTITDRWEWEERFSAPIDFSSLTWDNHVLKANCIDNSLAALIKANKGTKYEFAVGREIKTGGVFHFDRLPMQENLTYEFTQGGEYNDCADLLVTCKTGENPFLGNVGSELTINKAIDWNDDQTTDADSYLFKAVKDIVITLDYDISWRKDAGTEQATHIGISVRRNGSDVAGCVKNSGGSIEPNLAYPRKEGNYIDEYFSDPGALATKYPNPNDGDWTLIGGIVWYAKYNGSRFNWANSNQTQAEYCTERRFGKRLITLLAGDEVYVYGTPANASFSQFRVVSSKFVFGWLAIGDSVDIPLIKPNTVATALLRKMCGGFINASSYISDFDKRLASTYLMAAESVRGISGAKFYSSFTEFCDWMSTVFGYTYHIGEKEPSRYKYVRECGEYQVTPWAYEDTFYAGSISTDNIIYIAQHARFFYHERSAGKLYAYWNGHLDYNDATTHHPRTDTLFRIKGLDETSLYYFDEFKAGALYPTLYDQPEESIFKDHQTVRFVHRSEIFKDNGEARRIGHCRELSYTIDSANIYSSVTVGYDKKDYDSMNGRDEFNFNNTYSTGCSVSDKSLSLLSKYRADCYGLEFAVQKRGSDTTDSTSDKDVFFVLCANKNGNLIPDRTVKIENGLTDSVFNGAFSPMACVIANAGFIGKQSRNLHLEFASSYGNGSIVIDGKAMTDDIDLGTPLFTCGKLEFKCEEVDEPLRENEIVEVESGGVLYRGFIEDAAFRYANNEAVKYKLIVKDIEP